MWFSHVLIETFSVFGFWFGVFLLGVVFLFFFLDFATNWSFCAKTKTKNKKKQKSKKNPSNKT